MTMPRPDARTAIPRIRSRSSRGPKSAVSFLLLLLLPALLLLICAQSASAYVVRPNSDDEITGLMTLSPTSVELNVVPGQILDSEMTIVNRTGKSLSVDFLTEDFEGSNDPTVPAILLGTRESPQGAKTWLEPEVGKVTINQGETVVVNVRITVPQDASPGGHYGIFLASFNTPMAGADGTGMNVISRVGCYFLFRVAGDIEEAGSLDQPIVDGLTFSGPVKIGLQFNNEGTIHLKPSGMVRIKNMLGMTVAEIPVAAWTVMPDVSRYTEVTWERELLFGRYTVEAMIDYGSDSRELVSFGSFWGFSWIILLILLIILIIIALIILWRRRRQLNLEAGDPGEWDGQMRKGLEVAQSLISAGETDTARAMLREMRSTAHNRGLYHEVVMIDDLLLKL